MLGRLARYLRFLGHDTEYVRGLPDEEVAARALQEGRRLLTRDRDLARRTPGALCLESIDLGRQLRAVRDAEPLAGYVPNFTRCTVCNGALRPVSGAAAPARPPTGPVFACDRCGHRYWEGSHTARVRRDVERWLRETP